MAFSYVYFLFLQPFVWGDLADSAEYEPVGTRKKEISQLINWMVLIPWTSYGSSWHSLWHSLVAMDFHS